MIPVVPPPPLPPPEPPHHCLEAGWRDEGRPPSLGSVVSEAYPLRVHWSEEGYEDRAALILGYLEVAWAVQVDQLGFQPPVLPDGKDGPELDLYLLPLGDWQAWAWAPEEHDAVSGDGRMGAAAYMGFDQAIPDEWVGIYAVHEFNHVLQYATDFTEQTTNVWEASATAAQFWTLGDEAAWDLDVGDFQATPWMPALVGDGYWLWDEAEIWSYYEYGAALWVMHLDRACGVGDGTMGPALWEALAAEDWSGEPDVLDAIPEVCDQDLGEFMATLAASRWLTGQRWTEVGLEEAAGWGAEERVPALELSRTDLPAEVVFDPAPHVTGQGFVRLALHPGPGTLVVSATSGAALGSSIAVIGDGVFAAEWGEDPILEVHLEGLDGVGIALSNLGPPGFDDADDPYRPGDQVLHLSWEADEPPGPGDEEPPGGCGCASSSPVRWWAPWPALLILARRRLRGPGE